MIGTVALGYLAFWPFQAQSNGALSIYAQQVSIARGIGLYWLGVIVDNLDGTRQVALAAQMLALGGLSLLIGWVCWRRGIRQEAGVLAISALWVVLATQLFTWYIAVLVPLLALYLRAPRWPRDASPRPADLSSRFATPALGIWLFTLLMPFTYVIFAEGFYHPAWFRSFF